MSHRLLFSAATIMLLVLTVLGSAFGIDPSLAGRATTIPELANPAPSGYAGSERPNFIVIMSDDQAMNTFTPQFMPETFKRLAGPNGTRFTNSLAAPPLCCPARAGFQTGQYPHHHGVFKNDYDLLTDKGEIISTWLQNAGYTTGFAGKYMNQYLTLDPAPGYDYWWGVNGKPGYYDYNISDNGTLTHIGDKRSDYSTTAITRHSLEFLRGAAASGDPFFLWTSYYAPHGRHDGTGRCMQHAPLPDPKYFGKFDDLQAPRPPGFNEDDFADKAGTPFGAMPKLNDTQIADIDENFQCVVESMQSVDDGVASIDDFLDSHGLADNTVVIFISDNGFYYGEHRKESGKAVAYEPALRVPLLIRTPPQVLGSNPIPLISRPVANIDLAPTIVDLAGAKAGRLMDGRSIVPLLRRQRDRWPSDRAVLVELGVGCTGYEGLRTRTLFYVENTVEEPDGSCGVRSRELYDLIRDPNELDNLLYQPSPADRSLGEKLAVRLDYLRGCAGSESSLPHPCE